MGRRVVADPSALEASTRDGRVAVARAGGDVDVYREAISRYACAPTDLPVSVREWTGDVEVALRASEWSPERWSDLLRDGRADPAVAEATAGA